MVGLDPEDGVVLHPAAPPDEDRLEDAEAEHEQAERAGCRSRSWSSIGPSMSALMTSGIAIGDRDAGHRRSPA